MRLFFALTLILFSAGCNFAVGPFMDAPAQKVTVGLLDFGVRREGRYAEAVRLTPMLAPALSEVAPYALAAIKYETKCKDVFVIRADATVTMARLNCSNLSS